jgi:hypothetical protein
MKLARGPFLWAAGAGLRGGHDAAEAADPAAQLRSRHPEPARINVSFLGVRPHLFHGDLPGTAGPRTRHWVRPSRGTA